MSNDCGQATGKFYHLRLRVKCTLCCNLQSRARTLAVLLIGLYELAKLRYILGKLSVFINPGTPASSTTKTGRHDIAEILLKMALKHQKIKSNRRGARATANSAHALRTINIRLILSTIYIFIPVSGCVGRVPVHCFACGLWYCLRRYCTATHLLLCKIDYVRYCEFESSMTL
jgi:hypothetical protein